MSLESLLTQDVTVATPVIVTDEHGNPERTWDGADRRTYKGYLEQRTTKESTVAGQPWVTEWILVLLPTAVIGPDDRVEAAGSLFEIIGLPDSEYNPRTKSVHHKKVELRLTGGG
jgi:hypothetical protein